MGLEGDLEWGESGYEVVGSWSRAEVGIEWVGMWLDWRYMEWGQSGDVLGSSEVGVGMAWGWRGEGMEGGWREYGVRLK